MATDAPKANKTSVWEKLFGGGAVDGAAKTIEGRDARLAEQERIANGGAPRDANGYAPTDVEYGGNPGPSQKSTQRQKAQ